MWPQILASDPGSAPCMFEGPSPVHRARDSLPQSWGAEGHHGYMPPPSWGPQRGRLAIRSDTKTSSSQRLKLLPPPAPGDPPGPRPGSGLGCCVLARHLAGGGKSKASP